MMMEKKVRPTRVDELADAVADAARSGQRLAIRGGGSKDGIGASEDDATVLVVRNAQT